MLNLFKSLFPNSSDKSLSEIYDDEKKTVRRFKGLRYVTPLKTHKKKKQFTEHEKLMEKAHLEMLASRQNASPYIRELKQGFAPSEAEKTKTIYRWLSQKNIEKLYMGYAIEIQVNNQRISIKRRTNKCQ